MNRISLIAALVFAAAGAQAAEEFTPVKADSVVYPLPPMPLPVATTTAPVADGKWAETEDSPALRVSRAWVKLGQAAGLERSEATRKLYTQWKNEVGQGGTHTRSAQAAHARFLAAYKNDLENARKIYEGVLRDMDAMEGEGAVSSSPNGDQAAGSLAKDAEEQIRAADRDDRLSNSACFLSPDTCQNADPTDKALQDEISGLVKETLVAGGPDGGLSLYSLKRKASLLALRAKVMGAITTRAAARLATDVATQQDGQGSPKVLLSPIAPMASATRRPVATADPYR